MTEEEEKNAEEETQDRQLEPMKPSEKLSEEAPINTVVPKMITKGYKEGYHVITCGHCELKFSAVPEDGNQVTHRSCGTVNICDFELAKERITALNR